MSALPSHVRADCRTKQYFKARCDAETRDGKSGVSLVVAESESFDCAVAAVMYHARTRMSQESTDSTGLEQRKLEQKKEAKAEGDFSAAWIEKWYDGIGYCRCLVALPLMFGKEKLANILQARGTVSVRS
jgi:hypothetical protein